MKIGGRINLGLGANLDMGYGRLKYEHRFDNSVSTFLEATGGWLFSKSKPVVGISTGFQFEW